MSVNTQMTALADAVRNVTGKTGLLSIDAMTSGIEGLLEQTPEFIVAEAERVADLINWRDPDTFVMVCGSDMHLYAGNDTHEGSRISAKYAGMGIRELSKRSHIDAVTMLGDYSWMSSDNYSAEQTMKDMLLFHRTLKLDETAELWSLGNHDLCYGDGVDRSLTLDELNTYIGSYSDGVKSADNPTRCYDYLDFPSQKIRIINIDTCTPDSMTDNKWANQETICTAQLQWLAEVALDFSDKESASEWGVIIIGHHPLHYANNHFRRAMEILEAYRAGKATVTPYYTSNTYTFADDTNDRAEIICNIHGHNHNCGYSQISSSYPTVVQYDEDGNMTTEPTVPAWLWRFCVPNMSFSRYNTPISSTNVSFKYKFGEFDENGNAVYWQKEAGTAQATSFCVFAIDKRNKKINAYIFGAGKNRSVTYGDTYVPATYTIVSTLGNVTSSVNNPSTITEFQTASLTFTANDGYELPTHVTVSGADYTWDKSSGILVLSNPIGNVSITIDAVVLSDFTNQIPKSTDTDGSVYNEVGYKEGIKFSTDSSKLGAEQAATGIIATGFIPFGYGSSNTARGEQVIYLNGIESLATNSNVRIALYTADKTCLAVRVATQLIPSSNYTTSTATGVFYTADSNGYITSIDFTGFTSYLHNDGVQNGVNKDVAFFRFCSPGIDEESIITVNEPIEGTQKPTSSYTITNNLSNVGNSNTVSTITEGEAYTATLTASNGYTMDGATVTVTMSGTDVTDTVYANGVISIASVTGNIVITASAVMMSNYKNLLPLATTSPTDDTIYGGDYDGDGANDGYKNDTRYSSSAASSNPSSNGIIDASGYQLTGLIRATDDDIIRIKNITTIQFLLWVKNDGTISGQQPSNQYADGYDTQPDSNGVYTFKAPLTSNGCCGVRFSGKGITGETIITVNEEIV